MPTLTQAPSQGDVVKIQFDPNYPNEAITLLLGTKYKAGSVLGKITASGKYKLATAVGADGAQIAAAVLLNPVDATLADATGIILARGPAVVSKAALVFDASINTAPLTATKWAELTTVGIAPRISACYLGDHLFRPTCRQRDGYDQRHGFHFRRRRCHRQPGEQWRQLSRDDDSPCCGAERKRGARHGASDLHRHGYRADDGL